jgi:hypothetical protein
MAFAVQIINKTGEKLAKTYNQAIKLRLIGGPDAVKVSISEFADFKGASQAAYQETMDWLLSAGQGLKTIYAKYYTGFGVSSPVVSTEVELADSSDRTKEVLGVKITQGEAGLIFESKLLADSHKNQAAYLLNLNVKRNLTSERFAQKQYLAALPIKNLNPSQLQHLNTFIIYGTKSTQNLSWSKRFYLLKSYAAAYGRVPVTAQDWLDLLRIANGQAPQRLQKGRQAWAEKQYWQIFQAEPKNDPKSRLKLDIIAYGVTNPADDNEALQRQALKKFETIYKRKPKNQDDWNQVRAIAHSLK